MHGVRAGDLVEGFPLGTFEFETVVDRVHEFADLDGFPYPEIEGEESGVIGVQIPSGDQNRDGIRIRLFDSQSNSASGDTW